MPENRNSPDLSRIVIPLPGWRPDFDVLEKMDGALSFLLWEALGNVKLWADAPSQTRNSLFHPAQPDRIDRLAWASSEFPRLVQPLASFAQLVTAPALIGAETVATACADVAAWAESRGLMVIAAHFSEAAARALPESAACSNTAARLCRRALLPKLAGVYYQRGYTLAARAHQPEEAIRALLGYGGLMYLLDRYDRARKFLRRGAARARSTDRDRQAAEAEHDLMLVETEFYRFSAAQSHGLEALVHYPVHHPRVPYYAHDVGYFVTAHGGGAEALPLLHASRNTLPVHDHVLPWGTITRAAAAAGDMELYGEGKDQTLRLAALYPERAPAALRNVAYAAQEMQDWRIAEAVAQMAAEIAETRGERMVASTSRKIAVEAAQKRPGPQRKLPRGHKVEAIIRDTLALLDRHLNEKRGRPSGPPPPPNR